MTVQRSFKRLVRARMAKTGESCTAARAVLLAAREPEAPGPQPPPLATSDEAIRSRTGRGWEDSFDSSTRGARPGCRTATSRGASRRSSGSTRSPGTPRRSR